MLTPVMKQEKWMSTDLGEFPKEVADEGQAEL